MTATGGDSIEVATAGGRVLVNGVDLDTGPAGAASVRTLEVRGGSLANVMDCRRSTRRGSRRSRAWRFDGGGGFDHLIAPEALAATWSITGPDAGFLSGVDFATIGVFTFRSVENVVAGSGDDLFAFTAGAGFSGGLDAGDGLRSA